MGNSQSDCSNSPKTDVKGTGGDINLLGKRLKQDATFDGKVDADVKAGAGAGAGVPRGK